MWRKNKNLANADVYKVFQTPRVGLEPTTTRLTAECSTIELSRNTNSTDTPTRPPTAHFLPAVPSKPNTDRTDTPAGQAPGLLVPVSSAHRCASTPGLSTSSSPRGLAQGNSHLGGGFTLRCLQRLSLPDSATLPWPWRASRCTGGPSVPVLSY